MKTTGNIAATIENQEDGRESEDTIPDPRYIADLAIYAARFANAGGYDLGEAVLARLQELERRDRERSQIN